MNGKNIIQTKKISLYLLIGILSIIFTLFNPLSANAQADSINEGVTWLLSNQNPDGSWSEEPRIYLDTYTALEALFHLNVNNAQISQAVSWVSIQNSSTSDDLAHRVLLLSLAGEDTTTALTTLLTFKNTDNGWGTDNDFSSDVLDATLALQALKAVNYSDLETISYALFYLTSNQNSDGGLGFFPENESNVYMTALVLTTLQQFSLTTDLATAINKATDYLINQQLADGSWRSIYETSLSYIALVGVTTDNTVLGNAVNYLIASQLLNGSWNDDPYSTALALRALASVKPNLTIFSSDITFSDSAPTVGETITAHCPTAERKRLCIWNNNLYSTNKFSKVSNFHAIIS